MSFEDSLNYLKQKEVINLKNEFVSEERFLEFLFGIFLFYLSFERYRALFNEATEKQRRRIIQNKEPAPFPIPEYPFRFIGLGNKTLFIGKMNRPRELFADIIQKSFFSNYNHLDNFLPNVDEELKDSFWKKTHQCEKNYKNKYCKLCKVDAELLALEKQDILEKSFGISSSILINCPIEFLVETLPSDEVIELHQEEITCSGGECKKELERGWKFCPFCGDKINIEIKDYMDGEEKSLPPEKIFNDFLSVYLAIKYKYERVFSNYQFDKDFSHEVDIYLQDKNKIRLVEYTTKMDLDIEYVKRKIKTLSLFDNSLNVESIKRKINPPDCSLILLGINSPRNFQQLDLLTKRIFGNGGKFNIIDSKFKFKVTNVTTIDKDELTKVKEVFLNTLQEVGKLL